MPDRPSANHELSDDPPVRGAWRWLTERHPGQPIAGMILAAAVLERGHNLIWFPEGWLTRTGELQAFKRGIGMLLERYPVPVVPVAISGAHEAFPPTGTMPRPRPITVAFRDALHPEALKRQGRGESSEDRIANALRRHTATLYDRTRSAAQHRSSA